MSVLTMGALQYFAEWSGDPSRLAWALETAFKGTSLQKDPLLTSSSLIELIADYLEVDICGIAKGGGFKLEYLNRDVKSHLESAKRMILVKKSTSAYGLVMDGLQCGQFIPKDHALAPIFNAAYWKIRRIRIEPSIYHIGHDLRNRKSDTTSPEISEMISEYTSLVEKVESFCRDFPAPFVLDSICRDVNNRLESIRKNKDLPHMVYLLAISCLDCGETIPKSHKLRPVFDAAYTTIRRSIEPTVKEVGERSFLIWPETQTIIDQIENVVRKVNKICQEEALYS